MKTEEIQAVLDTATRGKDKNLNIAKHNLNNMSALLIRKLFNNVYKLPDAKGASLTTRPFTPPKQKDQVFHRLTYVKPDGTETDADTALSFDRSLSCFTDISNAAAYMAETAS